MVSHKTKGDIDMSLSFKGGLRFKRDPTEKNLCIGDEMRGKSYANRRAVHVAFGKAVRKCGTSPKAPAVKK